MHKYLLLFIFFLGFNAFSQDKPVVYVGAYHFPPYLNLKGNQFSGITPEVIKILNKIQNEVEFKIFITTSKRRYKDYNKNKYQMIIFEDKAWGWKNNELTSDLDESDIIHTGGEVFITKNSSSKEQSFFSSIKNKSKIGILGYHYKFADFNSDPHYLKENYNMTVVTQHENIIKAVSAGNFQLGIITKEYLNHYLNIFPEYKSKIIISAKMDQEYKHRILYKKSHKVLKSSFIENLIKKLKMNKEYKKLINKY